MLKIKKGLFIIGYGLSGGFGGIQNYEVIEAYSQDDADKQAWEMACETYESYVGMHGLRELSEIMEEDEIEDEIEDEDEAIIDATQEDIDFLDKRKEMYDNGYFDNLY